MSEFWLWFWRPIAEMLGVIALIIAIPLVSMLGFWAWILVRLAARFVCRVFNRPRE